MAATPICTVDQYGIHKPDLQTTLNYFANSYLGIYGSDVQIESSTQDGQLLGLLAVALDDVNSSCVAAYNSFIPSFSQGVGLSSLVKLNGLVRSTASYSTVLATVVGQAKTPIVNGVIEDENGYRWSLPTTTIPDAGQISVTATCQTLGAISVKAGDVFTISTPTIGWQRAYAAADATPGQPVEDDAPLRVRQSQSTMGPSATPLEGIVGALLALPGVISVKAYENDTDTADANGQPGRTIALVINGGADTDIAGAIKKKGPGVNTYGTSSASYIDAYGISHTVNFFRPNFRSVIFYLKVKALSGYTADVGTAIANALAAWVGNESSPTGLGVGGNLLLNRANVPANLNGGTQSYTYEIVSLQVAVGDGTAQSGDLIAGFIDQFTNDPATTTIQVVLS